MHKTSLSFIVLVILTFIVGAGCGKADNSGSAPCTPIAPAADSSALLGFAKANGITPVKDTTGVYYQIITQGAGATPNDNSLISVSYKGIRMDGTIFDSTAGTSNVSFQLGTLIPGWRIGIPKIQAGGHIKLLIPSAYGYGCMGSSPVIAPNSPIYFDLTLVSVQ